MATYKEIYGSTIEVVTSDPENPVTGQVWYNSTDNVVKGFQLTAAGSWSSGGNTNTSRYWGASAGDSTSGITMGGFNTPIGPGITNTELYNGTSWTEVNDLNSGRYIQSAAGTQTAALMFGGTPPGGSFSGQTESWNGTSWTEVNDLNTARRQAGSSGIQTSALMFGGSPTTSSDESATESWNGTSWTEVNDLNTARSSLDGGAIGVDNTSALAAGGYQYSIPGSVALTESWNGTSWTEVNDVPAAGGGHKFGTVSSAHLGNALTNYIWDGTSWASDTANSNNLTSRAGAGTTSAGMIVGGEPPSPAGTTTTEEYLGAGSPITVTFTDS